MPIPDSDFFDLAHSLLTHAYRTASTMPNNPHQYTLRKTWDDGEFCRTVELLRKYGYTKRFYRKDYTCFDVNECRYWTMGEPINKNGRPHTILINRAVNERATPYDGMADGYDELYGGLFYLDENLEIMDKLGYMEGESVLDIGCGTGLFLDYNDCGDYIGIDPSRKMLSKLREKHPDATAIQTAFENFYVPRRFDRAIALFGSASYIDPSAIPRIERFCNGPVFLMFYKDGYTPVNYEAFRAYAVHNAFGDYGSVLGGWEVEEWHNYIIATRR